MDLFSIILISIAVIAILICLFVIFLLSSGETTNENKTNNSMNKDYSLAKTLLFLLGFVVPFIPINMGGLFLCLFAIFFNIVFIVVFDDDRRQIGKSGLKGMAIGFLITFIYGFIYGLIYGIISSFEIGRNFVSLLY